MTREEWRKLELSVFGGDGAASRVEARMFRGNRTVNTRSSGGRSLYDDVSDLLEAHEALRKAVTHLAMYASIETRSTTNETRK